MDDHTLVFIGGLHRSGTTLLARCLGGHPAVSAFQGTGAPADEGQHLQSVYPPAKDFGGPGRFGFDSRAQLTEHSPLVSEENGRRLLSDWSRYWDLERPVLLEKSPPNLIRARFLQALFPEASFLMVLRHPVPVAYATQKWSRTSLRSLLRHWAVCHETFQADREHLGRVLDVRFEELVRDPDACLERVYAFLGLEPRPAGVDIRAGENERYFARWRARDGLLPRLYRNLLTRELEERVNAFGYSLRDLEVVPADYSVFSKSA